MFKPTFILFNLQIFFKEGGGCFGFRLQALANEEKQELGRVEGQAGARFLKVSKELIP
jgi:hypothetical protein